MPKVTDTLIRTDFASFVQVFHQIVRDGDAFSDDPYLYLLFEMAEDIAEGRVPKAIVNLPPGTGKSLIFAILLPAWILGRASSRPAIP